MTANIPSTGGPDAAYLHHLAQGRFRIQQCGACARHVFYPRVACPHCGSADLRWMDASGQGTVHACSVVMGKPGTGTDYAIVLVDLDEGVRMMGRVREHPQDQVRIGMRVQARIVEQDGNPLVVFVPQGAGGAQ
ncbi:MAG: OB-fold domain-containing protein [Diaphorobacter sp.]|uniref:Zn-ribbon domain-containing OB-fold protein n=1 Tax=Diaphorobacter nitroreducens TaxID=164759 RepID=UPI001D226588|nr:OB-fold domain-containing protein [Diaphorobacter nitroreducens]MBV2215953.1 OB-fold domain-containing protein [Diaphorobacter sp.]